jgi:hypothetical protein
MTRPWSILAGLVVLTCPWLVLGDESSSEWNVSTSFECSTSATNECAAYNRSCYQGACHACLLDFVELPVGRFQNLSRDDTVTSLGLTLNMSMNGTICVPLSDLQISLFERLFAPLWLSTIPVETRLSLLLNTSRLVTLQNLQVPRPTYLLGVNEYSADTKEEAQRLGGYMPPSNGQQILGCRLCSSY